MDSRKARAECDGMLCQIKNTSCSVRKDFIQKDYPDNEICKGHKHQAEKGFYFTGKIKHGKENSV